MHEQIDEATTLGRYIAAARPVQGLAVGSGSYGILALFEDGQRNIVVSGFETSGDAEIYARYLTALTATQTPPPVTEIHKMAAAWSGRPEPQPEPRRTGFEVVALMPPPVFGALQIGVPDAH